MSMYRNMIASKTFTHVRDFFAVSTSWSTCNAAFLLPIVASSFARFNAFSGFYGRGHTHDHRRHTRNEITRRRRTHVKILRHHDASLVRTLLRRDKHS